MVMYVASLFAATYLISRNLVDGPIVWILGLIPGLAVVGAFLCDRDAHHRTIRTNSSRMPVVRQTLIHRGRAVDFNGLGISREFWPGKLLMSTPTGSRSSGSSASDSVDSSTGSRMVHGETDVEEPSQGASCGAQLEPVRPGAEPGRFAPERQCHRDRQIRPLAALSIPHVRTVRPADRRNLLARLSARSLRARRGRLANDHLGDLDDRRRSPRSRLCSTVADRPTAAGWAASRKRLRSGRSRPKGCTEHIPVVG